ncbi:hypothetical protein NX786_24830 [Telluria mixta]|uniref:Uncharacterized protein n=1 Tax=Telluria mixta TaxID=34071 RepID=A0ABT2C5B0_9BURK|nr:hypothetical protein [Telluria mixta]MCS0632565.1 hypothetical protein [Telluria mixta]WEM99142.1 hypothetical protein P0M04_15950 [Telluria mixta]
MTLKGAIGVLLWSAGHVVNALALLAAGMYALFCVVWLHAPLLDVLRVTAMMALPVLGLAWLCRWGGRRLRKPAPATPPPPAKRWLLTVAGIIVAIACGSIIHTGVREYQCSVDRSEHAATHAADALRNGFEHVCEGDLARFDIAFQSLAKATRKLAFAPVDLTHTPFAQFESLGGRAENVTDVPSRLYRGFRMPDGHRVTLLEHDMSADGSRAWRHPKDEPERINGMRARLVVKEAPSGKAVSLLSWFEGRRMYELWIDANVVRVPLRDRLFALAASLPRAVPACPNEPPPPPMRFDANGYPVDEPPPQVLTQAQVDAIGDMSKRPCK